MGGELLRRRRGGRLLLLRLGHVVAHRTAADSAEPRVVTRHMAGDAAHDCTADTAGLGEGASRKRSAETKNDDEGSAHFILQETRLGIVKLDVPTPPVILCA